MAAKYYVCPIIGTGTEDDPYRPSIAGDRLRYSASIASDESGHPVNQWCVVAVEEVTVRQKLDANGERLWADVELPVRDERTGQSFTFTARSPVLEAVHHTSVLKHPDVQSVESEEEGLRLIEAKRG